MFLRHHCHPGLALALSFLILSSASSSSSLKEDEELDSNPLVGDGIDHEEAVALRLSPFKLATSSGLSITGTVEATEGDNVFYAFRGIRYAEHPIGSLRFRDPVVLNTGWTQLDSASDGPACPQVIRNKYETTNEDCLWLNVFTPELSHLENPSLEAKYDVANGYLHEHKFSKHAVLVFFHPTGPNWDSGWAGDDDYGPTHLLDYEVVLVTVNYRLGALGFLSGNLGLKDQAAALDWIQHNIDTFGGDPTRVTIVGHGTGGASAHLHMLSPLSRGKFKQAMSMSGAATNWWASIPHKEHAEVLRKVNNRFHCDSKPLTECLMDVDVKELLEFSRKEQLRFGPVVDGAFLPDTAENLMKSGKFQHCQWLVGIVSEEGNQLAQKIDLNAKDSKSILGYMNDHWETIKAYYFQGGASREKLEDLVSDAWFNVGVDKSVRLMGEKSRGAVYYYRLNQPNITLSTPLSHGEELPYLFPMILERPQEDEENQLFRKIFLQMITDYVRFGHPTKNEWNRQHLHHTYWRHYKPEKREFIDIAVHEIRMRENLYEDRLNFWHTLGQKTEL